MITIHAAEERMNRLEPRVAKSAMDQHRQRFFKMQELLQIVQCHFHLRRWRRNEHRLLDGALVRSQSVLLLPEFAGLAIADTHALQQLAVDLPDQTGLVGDQVRSMRPGAFIARILNTGAESRGKVFWPDFADSQ